MATFRVNFVSDERRFAWIEVLMLLTDFDVSDYSLNRAGAHNVIALPYHM